MKPEVSVIVLTFNQRDTISRALDSIIRQDFSHRFEIVVGDDGSTDGTREICEKYAEKYPDTVRLMPKAPNKGVVDNYFDTLAACRGRFISDCAGDDYWIGERRMQKQFDILESNPEVTLVHSAWDYYDESTKKTATGRTPDSQPPMREARELLVPHLAHEMPLAVHLSTAMFRKSVIDRMIERDRLIVRNPDFGCEDLSVTAALLASGLVAFLPEVTLHYCTGNGSTVSSSSDPRREYDFFMRTVSATCTLADYYGVDRSVLDGYLRSRLEYLSVLSFKIGDRKLRESVKLLYKKQKATPTLKAGMALSIPLWLSKTL